MFNLKRLTQFLWIIAFSSFLGVANTFACIPTIEYVGGNYDNFPPDFVKAGQSITSTWTMKNVSSCDAVNYKLGFYSSEPSTTSTNFGGNSHPSFTLKAGEVGPVTATFTAPTEIKKFTKIEFDILDENGAALPVLPKGRLWVNFTVEPSSALPEEDDNSTGPVYPPGYGEEGNPGTYPPYQEPDPEPDIDSTDPSGGISSIADDYIVGDAINCDIWAKDDQALDYLYVLVLHEDEIDEADDFWFVSGTSASESCYFSTSGWATGWYDYYYMVSDLAGNSSPVYGGYFHLGDDSSDPSEPLPDHEPTDDLPIDPTDPSDPSDEPGNEPNEEPPAPPPPPPPPPCFPTVKAVTTEASLEPVEPAQNITLEWQVENDQNCDANGFELAFSGATLGGADFSDGDFGSSTSLNVGAGQTLSVSVSFAAPTTPKEGGDFTVVYAILDENGDPTGEQLTGTFTVDPCLSIEPPTIDSVELWQSGQGLSIPDASVSDETGEFEVNFESDGNNGFQVTASNMCGESSFGPISARPCNSGGYGETCPKCDEVAEKTTVKCVGDPCNTSNGNFVYPEMEAIIAGIGGTNLKLKRTYNSLAALWPSASIVRYTDNGNEQEIVAGPPRYFGPGWTSPFGVYLLVVDKAPQFDGVQILYPDGHTVLFKKEGDGYISDSPANFDTLTLEGDEYVLTHKNSLEQKRFNADGHIIGISDRNGNEITFEYAGELLTRVENASGRWIEFTHNDDGQIIQAQLPEDITLAYEYTDGLLTAFIDGKGNRTEYQYDDNQQLVKMLTPKGHPKVQMTYDAEDWRVVQQIVGETELYALDYNEDATITTVTNAYGVETIHHYDEQGRIVQVEHPDGTTEQYGYDDDNNRLYYQDQAGGEWHWTYDERGNRLTADGPLGSHKAWEYNDQNLVVYMQERIDENTKREFIFEYDDAGNVLKVCLPMQDCATLQYDGRGLPTHFYDLANHLSQNEYNDAGDLIAVTNAEKATTHFEHDGLGRLLQLQKPLGNTYHYSYDPNSNLTAISGPLGYQRGFVFDANDNLITKIDPKQGEIVYHYNQSDKVVNIENQLHFAIKNYTYGLMSELIGFEDAEARAWTLTRDELSRITQIEGPLNSHSEFHYNAVGKIVDVIDAKGRVDHTEHDALYRAISVTRNYKPGAVANADTNVSTQLSYNLVGDVLKVIDPKGNTTKYDYDLQGRKTSKQNAEGHEWEYTYDPMGNLLAVLNPRGYTTQIEYTPTYRVQKVIDPEQQAITLLYNPNGKLTDKIDRRGVVTHNEYNELDRLVQRISNFKEGATADQETNVKTAFAYDLAGNLRFLTNPRGFKAELRYDAANRRIEVIDFEQGSTQLVYDKVENVLRLTDANENPTEYQYDDLDQLVAVINAENETKRFEYDVVGNRTALIEADETKTAYDYDALYRLNGVIQNFKDGEELPQTNDVNVTTQYGYDARGLLTSILNANENITLFEHDKVGQVIRETDPLNKVWEYVYDGVGNKVSRKDAKGNPTLYSYLPDDQLQKTSYFDGTAVQYAYDPNNNRTSMQDGLGATTWTYDPLNRRIAQDDPFSRVLTSVYDAASNRVGLGYADSNQVAYAFSPNNWLATVTDPHGQVTAYTRDKVGNITHTANPNAMVTDKTYDKVSRVLTLANRQIEGAKKTHSAFSYQYNLVGHVTQVVKEYGWQQPSEITETYTYDGVHRLATTTIAPLKNNGDDVQMGYGYDAVGNRLAWNSNDDLTTHEPFDGFVKDYVYNANNQLLSVMMDSEKPNGDLLSTFLYDANGNRINKLKEGEHGVDHYSTDYSFDPENRLSVAQNYQIVADGKRIDRDVSWLDYDGGGRRLAKHYDPKLNQPNGGGVDKEVQYVFDGLDPVAEYSMLNGQRTDFYRGAGNKLLTMHSYKGGTQGNMYWYHHNFKGDVSGLTKHNGNSQHNYRYDPYGGVVPENGNFTDPHNHYTLTDKEYDESMGLVWFGARHYDPETGVWLTQDSYRGVIDDPMSLHRSMYVADNPINYIDEYGYFFEELANNIVKTFNTAVDVAIDVGIVLPEPTTSSQTFKDAPYCIDISPYIEVVQSAREMDQMYCENPSQGGNEAIWSEVHQFTGHLLGKTNISPEQVASLSAWWELTEPHTWPSWNETLQNNATDDTIDVINAYYCSSTGEYCDGLSLRAYIIAEALDKSLQIHAPKFTAGTKVVFERVNWQFLESAMSNKISTEYENAVQEQSDKFGSFAGEKLVKYHVEKRPKENWYGELPCAP
ncbi:protein containing RHS repeats [Beggiatoa sp. PS]|nr:protein containing RHS repeats [Beggiatoa sp. PS]